MSTLEVIVFSLRGMTRLTQCLESVQWAHAVSVIHLSKGGSSIEAEALSCPGSGKGVAKVDVKRPSPGIKTDWVLHLWEEERVEGELKDELLTLCRMEAPAAPRSYRIPIRSRILGRWVEGSLWEPSPAIRLSREARDLGPGWWHRPERMMDAPKLRRGWIGDYSCAELSGGVNRINAVSDLWAERLETAGGNLGVLAMTTRPLRVFMRLLLRNGLFTHGLAGWTLSALAAYAALASGMKLWERAEHRL
jgi:hypothetical protein